MCQGDYGQYEPVSGSLQLVPRARGERRPCVPLRLYVMLAQGGAIGCPALPLSIALFFF